MELGACLMAFLIFLLLVFLVNQAFDDWLLVSGPGKGPIIYLFAKGKVKEEECATGYRKYEEKRHFLPKKFTSST